MLLLLLLLLPLPLLLQLADRLNRIAAGLSRPQKLGVMLQVRGSCLQAAMIALVAITGRRPVRWCCHTTGSAAGHNPALETCVDAAWPAGSTPLELRGWCMQCCCC
jgi:hypothetical protein